MIIQRRFASLFAVSLTAVLVQACGHAAAGGENAPTDKTTIQSPPQALATQADGAPADGATVTGESLSLNLKVDGAALSAGQLKLNGFECKVGDSDAFKPCGNPFVISGLKHGESYTIIVRGVLQDATSGTSIYATEMPLHFKVDLNATSMPVDPAHPGAPVAGADNTRMLASKLLLGSAYQVNVSEGMHVTEYSSTKTTGVLSYFRVSNESDRYYATQYTCNNSWDRLVASIAPSGDALMYCHSTPTREAYKNDSEYRLAHNHVEVATDTKLVTANYQERLSIAVYDSDFEFMNIRSRFWNACQDGKKNYITVPLINNFFLGINPEKADFWYCDTYQTDIDGKPSLWRVGAFFDIDHMDWNCYDCKYSRALEAVYMARANADLFLPEQFAKAAQTRILSVLTKLTP